MTDGWWSYLSHGAGCILLTKLIYDIGYWIYACFLRPGKNLVKEYGEWAVVTGATDGIGKAMAAQLKKQGMKVLLVSRTQDKLEATQKELGGGKDVDILQIDFGNFNADARTKMKKALESRDVGVVINNVGISYDHPEYLHELDDARVESLLKVNMDSTVWMTHLVLPKMVAKKKGAVVNIASSSAMFSAPLLVLYSGVKSGIVRFSQGLYGEYGSKGIHVQAQYPHFVTSKLSKIKHPSLTTPTPENYAVAAVKAIGYERDISPYWSHYAIVGVMSSLPFFVQDMVCNYLHHSIRKRALKKKAAAEKKE